MGTCWNCDKQLTLGTDETSCDNCGAVISYRCNDCKESFEIVDKDSRKKLEECKICGYFKCPHCGVCSWSCDRYEWERKILKILQPEINQSNYPSLLDKIRKIVGFIENVKIKTNRKFCPERNVPITYAKNRIKSLAAKFDGFKVKDNEDRDKFLERFKEITDKPIGAELTVSGSREKGSYGQEYRDAFNLSVCLGKFKIVRKKREDSDDEYDVFVRCEKEHCKYFDIKNLVINFCPNCKKQFPRGVKYCDVCPPYSKGENKGQNRKLKERLNNNDTCQIYRGSFKD